MFRTLVKHKFVSSLALSIIAGVGFVGTQTQIANAGTLTFTPINAPFGQPAPNSTTVNPNTTVDIDTKGFIDLIISDIVGPYTVIWNDFDPDTKVIANGESEMGAMGSITVLNNGMDGMVKVWGVRRDQVPVTNLLANNVTVEAVNTPEPTSLVTLLIIGSLCLGLRRNKNLTSTKTRE